MNDVMAAFEAKTTSVSELAALGAAATTRHPSASAVAELRAILAAPAHLTCVIATPDFESAPAGARQAA